MLPPIKEKVGCVPTTAVVTGARVWPEGAVAQGVCLAGFPMGVCLGGVLPRGQPRGMLTGGSAQGVCLEDLNGGSALGDLPCGVHLGGVCLGEVVYPGVSAWGRGQPGGVPGSLPILPPVNRQIGIKSLRSITVGKHLVAKISQEVCWGPRA